MSWYEVLVPHDRMTRKTVVWLEDTYDVELRVRNGFLAAADIPEWAKEKEDADGPDPV